MPTPARFTAERIVLRPSGDRLKVTGVYTYENPLPWPIGLTMRYPFPIDERHPWPAAVRVQYADSDGGGLGPIPSVRQAAAVDFRIHLPARGSTRIRVDYTQRSLDGTGTYIVTTTRR